MAVPDKTPMPQMSQQAIEAIAAAGGVSENSAQLHVHAHEHEDHEMNHLCIQLVGTPTPEGQNGFVMFCDMPM